ncbi:hypothetical protein [Microbacterium sp. LWO13-1.2]|uniref:hypothetical protein n=1 Tax=Microbacterium sp. LWO13-1.2 TaxID=3135262 RepID=UPI003138C888
MVRFLSVVSLTLAAVAALSGFAALFGVFALIQGTGSQDTWMWVAGYGGAALVAGILSRITQRVAEESATD